MTDAAMLYLLGVVVASLRLGAGASLATALLSVVVFDFIFIPPHLGFVMTDFRHLVTFAVMLFVAVVINRLARRMRDHAEAAAARERRTAALCDMSRDLVAAVERPTLVAAAARHIGAVFDAEVVVLAPEASAHSADERAQRAIREARWSRCTARRARPKGRRRAPRPTGSSGAARTPVSGRVAFPQAMGLYLPVVALHGRMGVVGVFPRDRRRFEHPEERRVLDAFVVHVGVALERTLMAAEAERVRLSAESERLRNALLSSVSHDLRTPLGAIEGASSTLVTLGAHLDEPTRQELAETIHEGAQSMARRVSNLLDMTRLEAGAIRPRQEWQPLEEVLGSALHQLDQALAGREVTTDLPGNPASAAHRLGARGPGARQHPGERGQVLAAGLAARGGGRSRRRRRGGGLRRRPRPRHPGRSRDRGSSTSSTGLRRTEPPAASVWASRSAGPSCGRTAAESGPRTARRAAPSSS